MRILLKLIVFIILLGNSGCSYYRTVLKEDNRYVARQLTYLNKESETFLGQPQQSTFEKDLFEYLKEYKRYKFFEGREAPALLSTLVVNENKKAIAFVVLRTNDLSGGDVEYVRFISAKFENNRWVFGVKEGHVYSFSYINKTVPRLTNPQLAKEAVRNLMLEGFFKGNYADKSVFKSTWYVF